MNEGSSGVEKKGKRKNKSSCAIGFDPQDFKPLKDKEAKRN